MECLLHTQQDQFDLFFVDIELLNETETISNATRKSNLFEFEQSQ